jgi:predicted metal-dependent phosphoesterase TrpH
MNADLHSHSSASDGLLEPEEVVTLAHAHGVTMLALTDHDQTSGLARAAARADELGLAFVHGVEISVSWREHGIHIVGLNIDPAHPGLEQGLARVRASRLSRGERIARELHAVGVEGSLEGALAHAGRPETLSRTHFARFLVERNYARDVKAVFRRFLARGKPGYVAHKWASLDEAVGWIRAAGGVAVIAHPARYALAPRVLEALVGDFALLGGTGIEVVSGSQTPRQCAAMARLARRTGLAASRGSDYHGPGESRAAPGLVPPLPADLKPVWQAF